MLHYQFRNAHHVSIIIATVIILAALPLTIKLTIIDPKDLTIHTVKIIDSNALYTIPEVMPKKTNITGQEIPRFALGSATMDVYKDILLNVSQVAVKNQSMCPNWAAKYVNQYFCEIDSDSPKSFSLNGGHWNDLNRTLFRDALYKIGPIMTVGDSLSGQMGRALGCVLETESPPDYSSLYIGDNSVVLLPFSDRLRDYIYWRFYHEGLYANRHFSTDWADRAIANNVSYIVYNTGAWWNPINFLWRRDWCHWNSWKVPTYDEIIMLYEIAMRDSLAPVIRRLKQDHGITTIWRDVAPAGVYDKTSLDIVSDRYSDYRHMFPVFSEIGRKVVIESGGLVLPIWDISFPHWQYHVLDKNDHIHWCETYTGESVPMMWVRLLYNMLYDHLLAAVNSHNATPSREWREFYKTAMAPHNSERVDMLTDYLLSDHRKTESVLNTTECHCEKATLVAECFANRRCLWNITLGECRDSDLLET